jgi:hypothetical protein
MFNSLEELNSYIRRSVTDDSLDVLSDKTLKPLFLKQESVQKKYDQFIKMLKKQSLTDSQIQTIVDDWIHELIPPGTKGVIRGNMFNKYVKHILLSSEFAKYPEIFDIVFERKHPDFPTDEIPDWYIYDRETKCCVIGMNQLDLWTGGAQINRGSKYILHDELHMSNPKMYFISVIHSLIQFTSKKSKAYKIVSTGFEKRRLSYSSQLISLIETCLGVEFVDPIDRGCSKEEDELNQLTTNLAQFDIKS